MNSSNTASRAIPFSTRASGYDPEQVNSYLNKLMGEYSKLQQSYTDLSGKYDELTKQPRAEMEAIGKVLVDAQQNASRIVSEAKAEASAIMKKAQQELSLIENEKTQLRSDISGIANRLKAAGLLA